MRRSPTSALYTLAIIWSFWCSLSAAPIEIIPLVAVGGFEEEEHWVTTIVIVNPSNLTAAGTLEVFDSALLDQHFHHLIPVVGVHVKPPDIKEAGHQFDIGVKTEHLYHCGIDIDKFAVDRTLEKSLHGILE